jgi:hypothetical protein
MALRVNRQHRFNCLSCGQAMAAGEAPALSQVTCPACRKEQTVPAVLGDLVLQKKSGTVVAGEVFRGIDQSLGRKVDVLVMKTSSASRAAVVESSLRVHKTLSQLDHPYLQRIHRLVETDGHAIIVTERRNHSLGTLVRSKPIPPADLLKFAIQSALGLDAAAAAGMNHMSLRPSCFQLCANLTIHMMGFSPWNHPALLPPAMGWGSLAPTAYLSPEVRRGKRPNAQSDMYAFGVCMLFFLTGQSPEDGRATGADIFRRTRDAMPVNWNRALTALLAADPAVRPETWGRVLELLENTSGLASIGAPEETASDKRERSGIADNFAAKGPSGFLDGMMSANVEMTGADETMFPMGALGGPSDDADFLIDDELANAKTEGPVDILAKAVMNGDFDASDSAMLRATKVGEIE